MELFIMRHGHAQAEAPRDSLRELSANGKLEVKAAVNADLPQFAHIQRVIHSPYLRAQQTAAIALDALGALPTEQSELLTPDGSVSKVCNFLHEKFHQQGLESIMIVGHQPLFGSLIDELCGLEPGTHRLATASIAAIDTDVMALGCCELRWLHHVL